MECYQENIMWINYLSKKILEEYETVIKLLKIDEEYYGYDKNIKYLLKFLKFNYNNKYLFKKNNDKVSVILEGNPTSLIEILREFYNDSIDVLINENNVGINSWIIKKFNEFYEENDLNIIIKSNFKVKNNKLIVIGSSAFCNEIDMCFSNEKELYIDE